MKKNGKIHLDKTSFLYVQIQFSDDGHAWKNKIEGRPYLE